MRDARSQSGGERRHADVGAPLRRRRGCLRLEAPLLRRRQWRSAAFRDPAGRPMSFTIAHITDPHLSPAPLPGRRRLPPQALHGLRQLEARARAAQRHGGARPHGRGPARPARRPCRGDGRPRQHRHAGRIPPRRRLDGDARRPARRQLRARQPRRLCALGDAAARGHLRALDRGRRRAARAFPICAFAARSRSSASPRACRPGR